MEPDLKAPLEDMEPAEEPFPRNPLSSQANPTPDLPKSLVVEETPPEFVNPLNMQSMLSPERIREMQNYFFDEIARHKSTTTRLSASSKGT